MGIADETLHAFGQSLGLPGLAFNNRDTVALGLEKAGKLFIEKQCDAVLVYLVRPFDAHREGVCLRALRACHFTNGHPYPVLAGLKGEESLAFVMRVPEREFTPQVMVNLLDRLAILHDQVAGA